MYSHAVAQNDPDPLSPPSSRPVGDLVDNVSQHMEVGHGRQCANAHKLYYRCKPRHRTHSGSLKCFTSHLLWSLLADLLPRPS